MCTVDHGALTYQPGATTSAFHGSGRPVGSRPRVASPVCRSPLVVSSRSCGSSACSATTTATSANWLQGGWEDLFDGQGPVYMQVSRGSLVLHLSEHHGDGTPEVIYVVATGVGELHAELHAKDHPYLNAGVGPSPGQHGAGACLSLLDPFGN